MMKTHMFFGDGRRGVARIWLWLLWCWPTPSARAGESIHARLRAHLGATNPTSGYGIVNHDYRMGTYEITNDQWNKFKAAYGTVTGDPSDAYDEDFYNWHGHDDVPTNNVSWYEAAQFVNWLNTSTGHQAAYKFTGTQGTRATTRLPPGTPPTRLRRGRTSTATRTHSISCPMRTSGSRRRTGTAPRCRPTRRKRVRAVRRATASAARAGITTTTDMPPTLMVLGTLAAGARNSTARTT